MVDATKHMPVTGGTLISDIKSLVSILRTRRTVVFAYGFVFAFVAFTVFLAFSPSSNSVSPWFANIFSGSSSSSSTSSSSDSYGSQFSNIFSYFFPDNSPPQQLHNFASPPPQTDTFRSNVTAFQSPNLSKSPPTETNHTQSRVNSDKGKVPNPNQTKVVAPETTVTANHSANLPVNSAPSVNKEAPSVKNLTQNSENANQTTTAAPKAPVAKNQSASPPVKSDSSLKSNSGKEVKGVAGKGEVSNNTTSLSKKQGNGTNSGVSVKQGKDSLVESLMNCDLFDGDWVRDDSYPLYKPGSCSLIDEQFNCISNGRPDKDYQKMRWKPRGCNLPRYVDLFDEFIFLSLFLRFL